MAGEPRPAAARPPKPRSPAVVGAGMLLVALGLVRGAGGIGLLRDGDLGAGALVMLIAAGAIAAGVTLIVRRRSALELLVAVVVAIVAGSVFAGRVPLGRRGVAVVAVAVLVLVGVAAWKRVTRRRG